MIGGNTTAIVQVRDKGRRNKIGEMVHSWLDVASLFGFLDYSGGQTDFAKYNAKVQETTHIFLCDFQNFKSQSDEWVWNPYNLTNGVVTNKKQDAIDVTTSENARMIIDGNVYQVLLIDDPMGLHQHLEVYLKYVGGGQGV